MSRFDYVKYDPSAQEAQMELKLAAQKVEATMIALDEAQAAMFELIGKHLGEQGRAHDLAVDALAEACLTDKCYDHLQQSFMWCGVGLRDDQIKRNGGAELQEERGNE